MKIVEIKCPACGAGLKADLSREVMFCENCGKRLLLDDEVQRSTVSIENAKEAGYDFERGRMNARSDISRDQSDKVQRMIDTLPEYRRLKEECDRLNNQLMRDKKESEGGSSLPSRILPYIIAAAIAFYGISSIGQKNFAGFLYILVAMGIVVMISRSRRSRKEKIEERIETTRTTMQDKAAKVDIATKDSGLGLIPEEYRTIECLEYIRGALLAQAVNTIPQAVRNYEFYKQHRDLVEQTQQQLEAQKKQLKEIEEMNKQLKKNKKKETRDSINDAVVAGTAVYAGVSLLKDLIDS